MTSPLDELIQRLLNRADDDSIQAAAQLAAYQTGEKTLLAERDRLHAKLCASPALAYPLPICVITGRIAGDKDACGDCDPCSAAHLVPMPVKLLQRECEAWARRYADAQEALDDRAPCPDCEGTGWVFLDDFDSDGSQRTERCTRCDAAFPPGWSL